MSKRKSCLYKKITLLVVLGIFVLIILSGCNSINHPTERQIKDKTFVVLKAYCQYPLTCEIIDNTVIIDNLDDSDFITSKGTFKAANAFNVYQQHTFRIIFSYFYDTKELIMSMVKIDGENYYI